MDLKMGNRTRGRHLGKTVTKIRELLHVATNGSLGLEED